MARASLRRGRVFVVTTLSGEGSPHHAFLSEDEVARRDDGRVALSVPGESRTAANLDARRAALLLFWVGRSPRTLALRRRVRGRGSAADPARRLYLLDVVREERPRLLPGESGGFVSGLRYERREGTAERGRRRAVKEELFG